MQERFYAPIFFSLLISESSTQLGERNGPSSNLNRSKNACATYLGPESAVLSLRTKLSRELIGFAVVAEVMVQRPTDLDGVFKVSVGEDDLGHDALALCGSGVVRPRIGVGGY
jgi:hypothetical protein